MYTSGGVEKIQNKPLPVTGVATVKPIRAEAVIRHNPDGTTSVIYPDDDEEGSAPLQSSVQEETCVVKGFYGLIVLTIELLEFAAQPTVPNVRHTSSLEAHWLQQLVDKYGDDYERMMWDKQLNPMQHTPAQLKRKIKKWRETANA